MNTTNALLALLITTTGANTILSANTSTTSKETTPTPIEQTQSLQDIQLQKAHTYIHTHCLGYVHNMNEQHDAPSHLVTRNVAKRLFPNDRDARQHYTLHNNRNCQQLKDALPHLFIK